MRANCSFAPLVQGYAVEFHSALARPLQTGADGDQSRLATARRADNGTACTTFDGKRDVAQDVNRVVAALKFLT